jgi:hypothetical protein
MLMKSHSCASRQASLVVLAVVSLVGRASGNSAHVVNFESDTIGNKGTAFTSVDSPLVTFSDPAASFIQVRTFFTEASGKGIEAFGTNTGMVMQFAAPAISLSILFGNDDPSFAEDRALLRVFSGASQVGQSVVLYNRNDFADETISISNVGTFDRAQLTYVGPSLTIQSNLGEIIEEIRFVVVPEPSSLALLSLGGRLLWRRRRG